MSILFYFKNNEILNFTINSNYFFQNTIGFQIIEDEAAKRIEMLVKRRVEEELEKRKDEIEQEVNKRVEAAKKKMEREMMIELEKRREQARAEEQKREVGFPKLYILFTFVPFFDTDLFLS